jgi:GMP synthase-like glutamine amidotransferase
MILILSICFTACSAQPEVMPARGTSPAIHQTDLQIVTPAASPAATPVPSQTPAAKVNNRIIIIDTNLHENELAASYNTLKNSVSAVMPKAEIKMIHYEQATPEMILTYNPKAIILGGQKTPWTQYPNEKLNKIYATIQNIKVPLLGICGGHQLIALAYGSTVAPIKVLDATKPGYEGCWREKGYVKINTVKANDPIFTNINAEFQGYENHCDEVKSIPSGFISIATGSDCKIQGFKHASKPIYGVQFHPEVFDSSHSDDKVILQNFLTKVK